MAAARRILAGAGYLVYGNFLKLLDSRSQDNNEKLAVAGLPWGWN
jgi:hypothetical protein